MWPFVVFVMYQIVQYCDIILPIRERIVIFSNPDVAINMVCFAQILIFMRRIHR